MKHRSCEIKAGKKFRPERDSNPLPLRYRCSALPTELSSHLRAGHIINYLMTESEVVAGKSQTETLPY